MTQSLRRDRIAPAADAALVGVAAFALYFCVAQHFRALLSLPNGPFAADPGTTARAMLRFGYEWKHPAFTLVTAPAVMLFERGFAFAPETAVIAVVALQAAASVALAHRVLARRHPGRAVALAFSLLYAVLFANLCIWSIPETYALSSTAATVYFLVLLSRSELGARQGALPLGAAVGAAALCNPPLASLALVHTAYAAQRRGARAALAIGAASLAIAAFVFLAVSVPATALAKHGGPGAFFERSQEYAGRYASLGHFADWRAVATVPLAFFAFGVIAPSSELTAQAAADQAAGYLASPIALALLALYGVLLARPLVDGARRRDPFAASLLLWMGALTLFYVAWDPPASLLFAPQVSLPLVLLLADGFARWPSDRLAAKWTALAVCVLLLGAHNLRVVLAGAWGF